MCLRIFYTDKKDMLVYIGTFGMFYSTYIGVTYSQLQFLFKNDVIVGIYNILAAADQDLAQLRIHHSFKLHYLTARLFQMLIPLGPVLAFLTKHPLHLQILDILCYCAPVIIRFIIIYAAIAYQIMLNERFASMNDYLEGFEVENCTISESGKLYERRSLFFSLQKVMEIYQKLTSTGRLFAKLYSGILFTCLIANFIQSVFAIVAILRIKHVKNFEQELPNLTVLLMQVGQAFALTYCAYRTEIEVNDE